MSEDCWHISMPSYTGMLSAWTGKKGSLQLPMREMSYTFYSALSETRVSSGVRLSFQILAPTFSMQVTVPKEPKSNLRFSRNRGLEAVLIKSFSGTLWHFCCRWLRVQNRDKETLKNMENCSSPLPDVLRIQKVSWSNGFSLHNTLKLAEQHCWGGRACCLAHSPRHSSQSKQILWEQYIQQNCVEKYVICRLHLWPWP